MIRIISNITALLGFIVFCFYPLLACGEKSEIINLQADNITYDYKKGIVHYDGNVFATQGQTELTADQMIIYYNQKHKIEKVTAIGKLARYKTLINDNRDVLKASARTIYYYPLESKVILREQAQVDYNQNHFSGPYIFYDMENKVISSHPSKQSQTKIVLEPIKQIKLN